MYKSLCSLLISYQFKQIMFKPSVVPVSCIDLLHLQKYGIFISPRFKGHHGLIDAIELVFQALYLG